VQVSVTACMGDATLYVCTPFSAATRCSTWSLPGPLGPGGRVNADYTATTSGGAPFSNAAWDAAPTSPCLFFLGVTTSTGVVGLPAQRLLCSP
jgi:hypothetical protein